MFCYRLNYQLWKKSIQILYLRKMYSTGVRKDLVLWFSDLF